MRVIKIMAITVVVLLLAALIGGYLFIHNFDLNKYKPYVTQLVEKETGRRLEINGEAEMGISLIPTVVLNDVTLANPEWAKNPLMLQAERIKVQIALLPLLHKQVVLNEVDINGATVNLEQAADGRASWDFKPLSDETVRKLTDKNPRAAEAKKMAEQQRAAAKRDSSASAPAAQSGPVQKEEKSAALLAGFAAENVLVENSRVSFSDLKSKQNINLSVNKLQLQVPGLDQKINAEFDLDYDGKKLTGQLETGAITALMENKQPWPVNLTAALMGVQVKADGMLAEVLSSRPRYNFKTNIYNPSGNLKAPETTLEAEINGDSRQAAAVISNLNIVNNKITGKANVNWSGKKPVIDAVLSAPAINLQNFSQNSNFALRLPSLIGEAQALTAVPDTAIDYSALNYVNGKADLTIGQLTVSPGLSAENVRLKATLNNGVLAVNPLQLQFGGGDIDAYLTVNAGSQSLQLKAVSQNMLLQNLHQEFKVSQAGDFGVLSGGKLDLDINVHGSGATYRRLVNNLNGSVIAIVGPSVLQTGNLKFLTGNFVSQLLAAIGIDARKSGKFDVSCAVVRSNLADGIANFPKGIAFNSKQIVLVADGKLNLLNDKLDFAVKPFSGKVVDTNVVQMLSSLVRVRGTVNNPKIAIDDKEVLKNIVGIAATGGTAYLGSKVLLDADSSPCYTALQGTPYAARFPKPTGVQAAGQDIYKGTAAGIDDSVKLLQNTAKDILGIFKKPKK